MNQPAPKRLWVGTNKGLVTYHLIDNTWQVVSHAFLGMPVSVVYFDHTHQVLWVCLAHKHWGPKLQRSFDFGTTWEPITTPEYPKGSLLRSGKPAKLRKIWCMAGGGPAQKHRLYLGTEPGGLFFSDNHGDKFHLMEGLWNHPSRAHEWFGAGRDEPFIHSIIIDPANYQHMYIAVSCAGVFETIDGGNDWTPKNKGLIATYLPNPDIEIGHDPHLVIACRSAPEVMWQQNHCGIFRTTNGGQFWDNVTGKGNFPNYGFTIAIDHDNPLRAWVIPATSDTSRIAVDLSLCVCYTEDGGLSWQEQRKGLPQGNTFDIVFRHAFDRTSRYLCFGTTTGNLFLSNDDGQNWQIISNYLPSINYVVFG